MKKYDIIFSALKLPLDFLVVFGSFFLAKKMRLETDNFLWIQLPFQTISNENLFFFALAWSILFIFVLAIHWLYSIKLTSSKVWEFLQVIQYSVYWLLFLSFFIYLWNGVIYETTIPRLIILFTFLITTIWIILERILLNYLEYSLLKKWILKKKQLLLINNKDLNKIKKILLDIKDSKIYEIIWYTNSENIKIKKMKFIWWIKEIKKLFEGGKCDEIINIDSDFNKHELQEIWELTRIFGVRYRYITNSFDITKTNTSLSLINNIPVIEINNTSLDNWAKIFKKIFDFLSWILGVIIFSPIMIVVAILIKLEDWDWPIIYRNVRIWKWWKKFNLYKFRYMKRKYCIKDAYWKYDWEAIAYEKKLIKENSTRHWPLYKIKDDPRMTRIWKFIEKYSIDEIPQFFNLIIWNMSLVWPRPHQQREVEKYSIDQKRLLTIRPWITGMAQVNGRENLDFKEEAELDIFYIENRSVLLDLKIIFKTFSVIIKR